VAFERVVFWDFDETLAFRPGRWRGCLSETLDEHEPGHGVTADDLRPFLRGGFPWHRPEVAHPELCEAGAWWATVEELLAGAYRGVGVGEVRAGELARLARDRYVDASLGWQLFDDTLPALQQLTADGWQHVVISNHVPELPELVEKLGLAGLIGTVFSSAITGYEKPHPEAFAIALRHCGFPGQAWMVGDNRVADVAGAEAVGIPAILVRSDGEPSTYTAADLSTAARIVNEAAERPRY
jgi:putative hydrolase of the HAD superfamily